MTSALAVAEPVYIDAVQSLCERSVSKHFDAYEDVAWDAPEMRIDPTDARFELSSIDTLGMTDWYRSLPAPTRARLGLAMIVSKMKVGLEFEGVLKRGLLEFATTLPQGAPEFRYAYHEVIEEAQHSLMFNEFINRTGFPAPGMPAWLRRQTRTVVALGRRFPELFFIFVLGGEAPIDHEQRRVLGGGKELHPLVRRIMQIHVTEEARHLSFAHHFLRRSVARLGRFRRLRLAIQTPLILSQMARTMLRPPAQVVRDFEIPRSVVREAYTGNAEYHRATIDGLGSVRELCVELGLVGPATRRLWRLLGIWPDVVAPPSRPLA